MTDVKGWKADVTKYVIWITAALLIGWDLYVYLTPPDGDTISEMIADWASEWTIVPFMAGVLMGHFFWPVRKVCEDVENP